MAPESQWELCRAYLVIHLQWAWQLMAPRSCSRAEESRVPHTADYIWLLPVALPPAAANSIEAQLFRTALSRRNAEQRFLGRKIMHDGRSEFGTRELPALIP
jgi:hypothetical protein